MSEFNVNDQVLIPSRNDGVIYTVTNKFEYGSIFLKENQYLIKSFGNDGIPDSAFIVHRDEIILV